MNESSSSSSSSRNSGRPRGGRRRRPNGPGSGGPSRSSGERDSSDYRGGGPAASAEKPSLLQRVLSIFTGGAKKSAPSSRPPAGGTGGAAPNANRNGYGRVPSTDEFGNRTARSSRDSRNSENGGGGGGSGDSSPGRERGSRKSDSVEVTTPRLYVGNLSFDTTEGDLSELFNGVGRVVSAEIVTHRQTQRSKGFAFVEMTDVAEAKRAVEQLHDKEFMGRKLFLSGAKSSEPHDGRDEPRFAS